MSDTFEPREISYAAMEMAAGAYWGQLGIKVCEQWRDWNHRLFDEALPCVPLVLSRMSAVHGHHFPLLDPAADQRKGYEQAIVGPHIHGYMAPQPVTSIRRGDLLRSMMMLYLKRAGLDTGCNEKPFCDLAMELHHRLAGERIWLSPLRETRETIQPKMPDGSLALARHVLKRVQETSPEGAPSLSAERIASWPFGSVDLPDITASAAPVVEIKRPRRRASV